MEIGSFHLMPWQHASGNVSWPFSDDKFDPDIGSELYDTYLDQLTYAEELGYDFIGLNEHHFTAYGLMPSPNLLAADLATRTDEIDIAIMGNVLPIRGNPIRVAEEVAMLDNRAKGRLISGFVRGIPTEYAAYNVDPNESRTRMREAWELIIRAWTEPEPFDWDGEFWQYDDVYIWPRPYQDPHPPLWMPSESQKSIEFAVEKRVSTSNVFVGTETLADGFSYYRKVAREQYDWNPGDEYFGNSKFIYVAETDEQAREEAEEHIEYFYNRLLGGIYRAGIQEKLMEDREGTGYREEESFDYTNHAPEKAKKALNFDFDDMQDRGEIIFGSPEYVIEEIRSQYEAVGGFGRLIALFQFGSLPDDLARKNLELFADEVMPEIEGLGEGALQSSAN